MLKQRVNEAEIALAISTVTPLLIKAGDTGADPTRPDMEFVQTYRGGQETIYIPGSSLKGAFRSHAERIIRTIGGSSPGRTFWACDPLDHKGPCHTGAKGKDFPEVYKGLCFACRTFGCMQAASHVTIADAYPKHDTRLQLEERNGVAIDRRLGSVAVGPFNYQVASIATFETTIRLVNFSLDQLGLLALVVRDFDRQQVSLGFSKSRGLGQVAMQVARVAIRYPACVLADNKISCGNKNFEADKIIGAGDLMQDPARYGFPTPDQVRVPCSAALDKLGFGVLQQVAREDADELWSRCVERWAAKV
ncbi:MAG TPA: RAMP superfamily CRISPR-associated protein [Candidatus Obscuribacterales bacterium]